MDIIFSSLLPFLLLMTLGYLVKFFGWVKADSWSSIEALSFKLFMPALVINAIYSSKADLFELGNFLTVFVAGVLIAGTLALSLRLVYNKTELSNASLSTVFQTTTRWNPFIIWPVIDLIYGSDGISLLSITIAVFVPITNIFNIIVVSYLNSQSASWRAVVIMILKNPIVIGCIIGVLLRNANIDLPITIEDIIRRLGECALVTVLLVIGANLDLRLLLKRNRFVMISLAFKMLLLPVIFVILGSLAGLNSMQMFCGILMAAVPTASNGYIIAKQMGGDAPLYSNTLTWQVVFSLFLLPILVKLQTVFA